MRSLWEISGALASYEMDIDPETGEWLNSEELDALNMEHDEKIESMLLWAKNLRAEASMVKEEKKNFDGRIKALEKKAGHIEDYVARDLNGKKFSTPKVMTSWRKSQQTIIDSVYELPPEYYEVSMERKPKKDLIKKAINNGATVPGAHVEDKLNMSYK